MRDAKADLSRDIATVALTGAMLLFLLGVACGTAKELGMLLLWGLAGLCLVIGLVAAARAVLLDHFKPPR